MKATFFERLGAYFIDMLVVFLIFSIICPGVGNNTNNAEKETKELDDMLMKEEITVEEYYEKYSNLLDDMLIKEEITMEEYYEKYSNLLDDMLIKKEITVKEYYEEYSSLLYDYQKENVLQLGISVALTIAYYVVFQYMNKGQTIGKKLLKIQVVDKDKKKPISILKGLLRSFIILSILSGVLFIAFLYIFNETNYITSYATVIMLEGIFTLTTTMFVLYRKDRRGLHDMMANTIVIKESR